jgi:hypothetical protein
MQASTSNRIAVTMSFIAISLTSPVAWSQPREVIPAIGQVSSTEVPPLNGEGEGFAVMVRIPQSVIANSLNQEFRKSEQVHQIVLGTDSRGTAVIHGTVNCLLEENPLGAAFHCVVVGTVQSRTCGVNGPATIQSYAHTSYVARKRFLFDGEKFLALPTTVNSTTRLTITGVGSTLPRLRGRVVQRVASRRAADSLAEAEAITSEIARRELRQQIDREFDTRLSQMNQRLAPRLSVLKLFPAANNKYHVRSFPDCVEVAVDTSSQNKLAVFGERQPIGDAVEVWLRLGSADIPEMPTIAKLLSLAPKWLASYFSNNPQFAELDNKRIEIGRHDRWILLRLRD